MTTITATSILASRHAVTGDRVDTILCRYPRFIHAELMTHRVFSRNAASSRAIPFKKMVRDVIDNPAVPLVWGKNQKGMQAGEEVSATRQAIAKAIWRGARYLAIGAAYALHGLGLHKQIVNRLLEPWLHITVLISSTEWSNFFELRDHEDAEPHIHMLAQAIIEARETAFVHILQPGQWHLPFVSMVELAKGYGQKSYIPLSVARCASTSFKTVDGFDMSWPRAVDIYTKLVGSKPIHASPTEHVCQADDVELDHVGAVLRYKNPQQHRNFKGFRQHRAMLEAA